MKSKRINNNKMINKMNNKIKDKKLKNRKMPDLHKYILALNSKI